MGLISYKILPHADGYSFNGSVHAYPQCLVCMVAIFPLCHVPAVMTPIPKAKVSHIHDHVHPSSNKGARSVTVYIIHYSSITVQNLIVFFDRVWRSWTVTDNCTVDADAALPRCQLKYIV